MAKKKEKGAGVATAIEIRLSYRVSSVGYSNYTSHKNLFFAVWTADRYESVGFRFLARSLEY